MQVMSCGSWIYRQNYHTPSPLFVKKYEIFFLICCKANKVKVQCNNANEYQRYAHSKEITDNYVAP